MISEPIAPGRLQVGSIYLDIEGRRWGVLERDQRGGARLVHPPEDAPNWHGVTLDPDGAWWHGEERQATDPYLQESRGYLRCLSCERFLKVSPRTASINHNRDCQWLAEQLLSPEREPLLPAISPEDWDPLV